MKRRSSSSGGSGRKSTSTRRKVAPSYGRRGIGGVKRSTKKR